MIEKVDNEFEMLARHLEVFERVLEDHPIGIVKLSQVTEYEHHRVRYSLRILEREELIEPTKLGAVPTDKGKEFIKDHQKRLDDVISRFKSLPELEGMTILRHPRSSN